MSSCRSAPIPDPSRTTGAAGAQFLLSVSSFTRLIRDIHNLASRKHDLKYSVSGFPPLPIFSFRSGRKEREVDPAWAGSAGPEKQRRRVLPRPGSGAVGVTRHRMKAVTRLHERLDGRERGVAGFMAPGCGRHPPAPRYSPKKQNEPKKCFRINKSAQKRTQNEPKRTQLWQASAAGSPSESALLRVASKNEPKTNPSGHPAGRLPQLLAEVWITCDSDKTRRASR
jgi:hypothetical protein